MGWEACGDPHAPCEARCFSKQKAAEQTEVSIVSSVLSASSCSISLQCGGFLAIRPLTLPSPRSTGERGQVLVTKRVESETISLPMGERDRRLKLCQFRSGLVRALVAIHLIHPRGKLVGVLY